MGGTISIITCVVGVIGCIIGIATFVSAQITKAKQDGMLIAKIDQCVKGIDEIKNDMKDKNHEYDKLLDDHTIRIAKLEKDVENLKSKKE